ncbi:hypothetical protein H0178_20745 [Cytobacillus firmus]|nr:hypothetical protein [Cytobacillus firmus]
MRPLFQAVVTEIGATKLIAINYFDESGRHADQIIRGLDGVEELAIIDVVLEAMRLHKVDTVDIETDNDTLFKLFLPVPGVKMTLVLSGTLSGLYRQLSPGSLIYPLLEEICAETEPETVEEPIEETTGPRKPWYIRIFQYIKGVFLSD